MPAQLRDLVAGAAQQAAAWMSGQALLAAERDVGVLAELKRADAPQDLLLAGDLLHVALHRLTAELGRPSVLPPWPRPLGLPGAVADVAGAGLMLAGAAMRWSTFLLDDAARGAATRGADQKAAPSSAAPPPPNGADAQGASGKVAAFRRVRR